MYAEFVAGTPYMPDIRNKVLFLEDDNIMGENFCYEFERNMCSLLQMEGADTIRGIVFGADFGHIFPMFTFPIGGTAEIKATATGVDIRIVEH